MRRGPYVVLVDEYDVPLQGFLNDRMAVKRVRSIMHDFYVQLKSHSGQIRFMMMTGVTKLTKLSVFSGLNNPEDLTMDHPEYAGLLGYTPKEIEATYPKRLDALAKRQVAAGDLWAILYEALYALYAKIPPTWRIKCEADVKRHFHLFMGMLGAKVEPECPSMLGYADAIIETKKFVWVFEFKFNKSSSAAVRQIREKGYADPYKGDKRPVTLVGINFRTAKRNIDEPIFSVFRR